MLSQCFSKLTRFRTSKQDRQHRRFDLSRKLEAQATGRDLRHKSTLERRVSDFCHRRRKRTLMDLPEELLVLILEMTSPGLTELMGWSPVCTKIRRITISALSLWARQRISTSMTPTMVDKIICRSGTQGHDLLVKSSLVPSDTLSKHCHKCPI